ncbi:hypothetical protein EYF80_026098 [Liparis tanakae]|uniref:Uncharacterized protein n=1 Tax=Liparis tanakae TaxID=230148 RepID=A0A4Z2HDR6_9TELE|nr:hypothetical protein EYF80_026098 [Liparis tanakae]
MIEPSSDNISEKIVCEIPEQIPFPKHLPSTKPNWMAFSLTWASDSAIPQDFSEHLQLTELPPQLAEPALLLEETIEQFLDKNTALDPRLKTEVSGAAWSKREELRVGSHDIGNLLLLFR